LTKVFLRANMQIRKAYGSLLVCYC